MGAAVKALPFLFIAGDTVSARLGGPEYPAHTI
jgi:hypothetical protein